MSSATVLVVDDDPTLTKIVCSALEEEGYRVVSAVDGAALEVACRQRPAVVLLDLTMPQMGGAEVSRRLRADPATACIPIILMSAQPDLRGHSADLPVNERLAKPFDLDRLYALIAKWQTVTAGEHLYWRVSPERSFAFDRPTHTLWVLPLQARCGMLHVSASADLLVRRPRRYRPAREVGHAEHTRYFPSHPQALAGGQGRAVEAPLDQ